MAQAVLIDSNVYIQILRSGRDVGRSIDARYHETDVVTCGIVRLEVLRGIVENRAKSWMDGVFSIMCCVSTDQHLWEEATELAWTLDRSGVTLPAQDIVIAACAMRAGAIVHTYDRHFTRIPGLTVATDPL